MAMFDPALMLLIDIRRHERREWQFKIARAIEGGVTSLQLREKHASRDELLHHAREVQTFLKPFRLPLLINDDVDVAKMIEADGVHLGQHDLPFREAISMLSQEQIIGLSITHPQQILALDERDDKPHYFGIGPLFPTKTKEDAAPCIGLNGLSYARRLTSKPLIAIGGINLENAAYLKGAGADGMAIISSIWHMKDPLAATQALIKAFHQPRI